MNIRLKELEDKISYHFQDKNLLTQALTHSSYANEHRLDHKQSNSGFLQIFDCRSNRYTVQFRHRKFRLKRFPI